MRGWDAYIRSILQGNECRQQIIGRSLSKPDGAKFYLLPTGCNSKLQYTRVA